MSFVFMMKKEIITQNLKRLHVRFSKYVSVQGARTFWQKMQKLCAQKMCVRYVIAFILFTCGFVGGVWGKMHARETIMIGHDDYLIVSDDPTAKVK